MTERDGTESGAVGGLQCVVLDCPDVRVLAEFYGALLGGEVDRPDPRWSLDDDWATVHTGTGTVLAFQRAAGHRPPSWPGPERPQQFHLDVGVSDLDRVGARVLALGAELLEAGPDSRGWRVYADPAGHPFCLVRESIPVRDEGTGGGGELVRDGIPRVIRAAGREPVTHAAGPEEYRRRLRDKLDEEVGEFLDADDVSAPGELADVLEVVLALAADLEVSPEELERLRARKAAERGGFTTRTVWTGNR